MSPWTLACLAPLSMGFSRQEYWRVLPFPSPGDLPDSGIKSASLMFQHWQMLTWNQEVSQEELRTSCRRNLPVSQEQISDGGGLVAKCPTLATPRIVAWQAPLSMGFFRQEYWSGLPFPSPGDLPNPGIEHESPALQADSLLTELGGKPQEQIGSPQIQGAGRMLQATFCDCSMRFTFQFEKCSHRI